jgi:hypothetical protein
MAPAWLTKAIALIPPSALQYKTPKFIKVDVPQVAILHKSCQALAALLTFVQLYFNDGWAETATPGGMSNGWGESGSMMSITDDPYLAARTTYCSNVSMSFDDGPNAMIAPVCEPMLPAELVERTVESVFFTTAVLETTTIGWPCANSGAAARETDCVSSNGTTFRRRSGQCGCTIQRAVYPLAVEDMTLA